MVFGEVLVDVYPDEQVVAGALLHVAAHLSALGWTTRLVTRVGADEEGARLRSVLARHGLDSELVEVDGELPTGRVTVRGGGGLNLFTVHRPAAWDAIAGAAPLPAHEIFCYGTLAARSPVSRATLRRQLASSRARLKALDVNLRPPDLDAGVLRLALGHATLVKANEEEVAEVARTLGAGATPADYFAAWPTLEWLCITRGSDGASLHGRGGGEWSVAGASTEVADTVGAGDAFMAGLVDALARDRPPEEALAAATGRAASVLGRRGGLPDPPERAAGGRKHPASSG